VIIVRYKWWASSVAEALGRGSLPVPDVESPCPTTGGELAGSQQPTFVFSP
jgi:hypothetical protein